MIGFLSPEGQFYSCESYGHLSLAETLTVKLFNKDLFSSIECEDFLLDRNFIIFQIRSVYKRIVNKQGVALCMTGQQIEFIKNNSKLFNEMQKETISRMLLVDAELVEDIEKGMWR